ncbi:MAG TPA: inositol monophosphatase [Candidatus Omnitrophica bacterium]|nr:MAG: inositol monophosphatase [Candidatus Omnitrophota bacterium]HEC68979.1 inositol monophosphatase [Candidatus Omnitrophota bacterium]
MLEVVKSAVEKAGDFLFSNFGNIRQVISKGDRNLVTDLDREAEKIIVDVLSKEFPEHGILGEEAVRKDLDREFLWIIDPLDGTHNFIRGIDIFGVSAGLWHRGDFILGVVYFPKDRELYWAEKGKGAFKNGERILTSQVSELKKASGCFDSAIRYSPQVMLKVLGELTKKCFNVRMFGSSVRSLTYLAEGKIDFTIEFYDRPWDFAGSVCIVKEAGGVFFDLKGNTPTPKTIGYVASTSKIYPQLRNILEVCGISNPE